MLINVDNYPIVKNSRVTLLVRTNKKIEIKSWFYDPEKKKTVKVSFIEEEPINDSKRFTCAVPNIDGFFLINVNGTPVIRKVGHQYGTFILGYKKNYKLPMTKNGIDGYMDNIIDIFYCTDVQEYDVIKVLKKEFIIPKLAIEKIRVTSLFGTKRRELIFTPVRRQMLLDIQRRKLEMTVTQTKDT